MNSHAWHSINVGQDAPRIVNTLIEIPKGSHTKYEIDKDSGFIKLDRVLMSSIAYPFHYGFIPQTYGPDNDPLDAVLLCSAALVPLTLVEMRVLGVMLMDDQGEDDHKIIGVAHSDFAMKDVFTLQDLPLGVLEDIQTFFSNYKKAERKIVSVKEFEDIQSAYNLIEHSIASYNQKFPHNHI